MKTLRPLVLTILGCPALLLATPVDSHISAATVYSDRVVVTRTAGLELVLGENTLVFEHLPSGLVDQSLQFSGHGAAAATILDVNAATAFVDSTPNARAKDLEDQINELNKQGRTLDDRAGVLNQEREFVKRMLLAATEANPAAADSTHGTGAGYRQTLEDWQKLYAYTEDVLGKIAAELHAIDDQRNELAGKKAALKQQLDVLRDVRGKSVKSVTVRMAVTAAGQFEVALRYAVPGATWVPTYDARLRAEDRAVELSYYGLVRNATGEDWKDVALTLSTARPSLGGGAPELRPWVVDVMPEEPVALARFSEEAAVAGKRAKSRDVGAVANSQNQQFLNATGGMPAPEAPAIRDASELAAVVEANATSATFRIPGPVSILANNSMQKVSIASAKLAATLQYEATPKMVEAAFLSAAASNTTDYPFLAGSMNTFLDDTFIAASRLKTVMPGERFELHLGADEGIAIKRKLVNRFAENTGLTNNGRRVTYEYLLTITNNKKTAERVALKEPLPVSRQEKIVVKLLVPDEDAVGTKESPKEVTREEDGKLVWHLDLKPAEKREIALKFSVSYPGDVNVAGLE
jgi:uncharacterized protein (TIGR02231 family)